jgi:Indigoidine synthase A like protein
MPPLSRGLRSLRIARTIVAPHFQGFKRFQSTQSCGSRNGFFKVSEEVQGALATEKPVVALETTIYTHGKPDAILCLGFYD